MKDFFFLVFLFFPLSLIAQNDVIQVQAGSKTLSVLPDVQGNILAIDDNGAKQIITVQEIESFIHGSGTTYTPDEPLDMTMFPNFPVPTANTGYNAGFEGILFCNMDADPELEIVINLSQATHVINIDGTPLAGWPKTISQGLSGGPISGDIDGDGEGEIVCASYSGSTAGGIQAYEKNGTAVTGFPVNTGYIWRSPVLADLNNDGSMEIIASRRQAPSGQVIVLKGDGTPLTGWPQSVATVPGSGPAVGDITGDNSPEIIFEALNSLYAFDAAGNVLPGFPYTYPPDAISSYSSPVLADINNDGFREIIFGLHESAGALRDLVVVLKKDGTVYPGWPKYTGYWVYSPPSVGYINNDNVYDIAVGDQVLSGTPANSLYAWDINGNPLAGFPVTPVDAINAHTLIADIDGDNLKELIFDNNSAPGGIGKYHAVNHDGSVVPGWPLNVQGSTFYITPSITDINLDNTMDMIGAGTTGSAPNAVTNVCLWNAGVPYSAVSVALPMFMYNITHSGVFDKPTIVPVEMESFTASVLAGNVILEWITVTETNNSGFKLYRNNEYLAFIEGKGTTTEKQIYNFVDKNVLAGSCTYKLEQIDYNGTAAAAAELTIEVGNVPEEYSLQQNYPNPFNPATQISFSLAVSADVSLKIYDVLGREAAVLLDDKLEAGRHSIRLNASSLNSGVYFYTIEAKGIDGNSFTSTKKMTLLK